MRRRTIHSNFMKLLAILICAHLNELQSFNVNRRISRKCGFTVTVHYSKTSKLEDVSATPLKPISEKPALQSLPGKDSPLTIRDLQDEDLPTVVRMCVKEFGSFDTPLFPPSQTEQTPWLQTLNEWNRTFETFAFALMVGFGLTQRIQRRRSSRGDADNDHNVICLLCDDEVVGIAEVSRQPLDPNRTAPPVVLPLPIKGLWGKTLVPYISNVLIHPRFRGKGYGKVLMRAAESRAYRMGYDEVYLHVDATAVIPRNMYEALGYTPFLSEEDEVRYAWMGGGASPTRGLYFVDGCALLYLTKKLAMEI